MTAVLFPLDPVLIVDDEMEALQVTKYVLLSGGINNVLCRQDSREISDLLARQEVAVALLDLTMPHVPGGELLAEITQKHPDVPVIIVTGANDLNLAVRCMQQGAFDYLVKPVEESRMLSAVRRATEMRDLRRENTALRKHMLSDALEHPQAFSGIVTNNAHMRALFQYIETIAGSPKPVLITGETGVGKELFAVAIHQLSDRKGAFVPLNVAGLDETSFSDTLFGHLKGAFTGADEAREGLLQQASGGTLFLDEIGDLSPVAQIKLLRLLQEGEYSPLGSDVRKRTDARIVVATNREIKKLQENDQFRHDLYYRLHTHHVEVPPLRERLDDLPVLLDRFITQASNTLGKKKPTPPKELIDLLSTYRFPGNIRELESMVFDAVARHKSKKLSMEVFKSHIRKQSDAVGSATNAGRPAGASPFSSWQQLPTLKESAGLLIDEALRRTNGNQSLAAELLGISPPALSERLKRRRGA